MTGILDRVAVKQPLTSFRPTTARELFVLRLAQKLGEPSLAPHYFEVASKYKDETLLHAYRHVMNHANPEQDLGKAFHAELASARRQDNRQQSQRLLAVKVERRSIAVAIYVGLRLDFHDMRTLGAQPDKADASAVGFLRWVIGNFEIESATLEKMTNGDEIRRAAVNRLVVDTLRSHGLPIWEVAKKDLLEGFSYPALVSRSELRQAINGIVWSMLNTDTPHCQELDAAAVGLHIQTERQFLI